MNEQTLGSVAHQLERLVREIRWWKWVGIVAFILIALTVLYPRKGRYQIIQGDELIHRLDTKTGEMQAFAIDIRYRSIHRKLEYWPVDYISAHPDRVREWIEKQEEKAQK